MRQMSEDYAKGYDAGRVEGRAEAVFEMMKASGGAFAGMIDEYRHDFHGPTASSLMSGDPLSSPLGPCRIVTHLKLRLEPGAPSALRGRRVWVMFE